LKSKALILRVEVNASLGIRDFDWIAWMNFKSFS
jgi:hypothetical protein